jgi:hypothetical protein
MNSTDEQARQAAIRKLIAVRAYEMWENQGRPAGCDAIHWRQAEQDVMSSVSNSPQAPSAPPAAPTKRP